MASTDFSMSAAEGRALRRRNAERIAREAQTARAGGLRERVSKAVVESTAGAISVGWHDEIVRRVLAAVAEGEG